MLDHKRGTTDNYVRTLGENQNLLGKEDHIASLYANILCYEKRASASHLTLEPVMKWRVKMGQGRLLHPG